MDTRGVGGGKKRWISTLFFNGKKWSNLSWNAKKIFIFFYRGTLMGSSSLQSLSPPLLMVVYRHTVALLTDKEKMKLRWLHIKLYIGDLFLKVPIKCNLQRWFDPQVKHVARSRPIIFSSEVWEACRFPDVPLDLMMDNRRQLIELKNWIITYYFGLWYCTYICTLMSNKLCNTIQSSQLYGLIKFLELSALILINSYRLERSLPDVAGSW